MNARISILLLVLTLSARAQSVFLGPGDSVTYTFNSMRRVSASDSSIPASFGAIFGSDLFDESDIVQLETFEDSANGTPFGLRSFIGIPGASISQLSLTASVPNVYWQDGQGAARVSVLSGTIDIHMLVFSVGIVGTQFQPGGLYQESVIVPEPSCAILLCMGIGAAVIAWRRVSS